VVRRKKKFFFYSYPSSSSYRRQFEDLHHILSEYEDDDRSHHHHQPHIARTPSTIHNNSPQYLRDQLRDICLSHSSKHRSPTISSVSSLSSSSSRSSSHVPSHVSMSSYNSMRNDHSDDASSYDDDDEASSDFDYDQFNDLSTNHLKIINNYISRLIIIFSNSLQPNFKNLSESQVNTIRDEYKTISPKVKELLSDEFVKKYHTVQSRSIETQYEKLQGMVMFAVNSYVKPRNTGSLSGGRLMISDSIHNMPYYK